MGTASKFYQDVLIEPVVSEKTYGLMDANKYTFLVRPDANKTEIKIAVEKIFDVKVTSVNTLNRQGKSRKTRYGVGRRSNTKRAIVSLAEGHRIDIFNPPIGTPRAALARGAATPVVRAGDKSTTRSTGKPTSTYSETAPPSVRQRGKKPKPWLSVATHSGHAQLLGMRHADRESQSPASFLLATATTTMSTMRTLTRSDQGLEAASFAEPGLDPLVVERHEDFVLASWPTNLEPEALTSYMRDYAELATQDNPSSVSVYVRAGNQTLRYEDGEPIDWAEASDTATTSVRVETTDSTLMWRVPLGEEADYRVVVMALELESTALHSLLADTGVVAARELALSVLGEGPWALRPLGDSA